MVENGPWSSDNVTVTNKHGLRSGMVIQQPVGSWTATYAHDSSRRLASVTAGGQTWSYDYSTAPGSAEASIAAGLLIDQINLPGSHRIERTHDSVGRLTDTSLKTSGGTLRNDLATPTTQHIVEPWGAVRILRFLPGTVDLITLTILLANCKQRGPTIHPVHPSPRRSSGTPMTQARTCCVRPTTPRSAHSHPMT